MTDAKRSAVAFILMALLVGVAVVLCLLLSIRDPQSVLANPGYYLSLDKLEKYVELDDGVSPWSFLQSLGKYIEIDERVFPWSLLQSRCNGCMVRKRVPGCLLCSRCKDVR